MIVISIVGPSLDEALDQLDIAQLHADIIEWRIDHFADLSFLKKLHQEQRKPWIATLRKTSHGGKDKRSDLERLEVFQQLAVLQPDFIDFEMETPIEYIETIQKLSPTTKVLLSYHNFEKTPENLESILTEMRAKHPFGYKLATQVDSIEDILQIFSLLQAYPEDFITAIGMGEKGQITRILQPVLGNGFCYSCMPDQPVAPGQVDVTTLIETYRYKTLNKATDIYALLGNPVSQSPGHKMHNKVFSKRCQNAVYIKIDLEDAELASFFTFVKKSSLFKGFSVTMPLKEAVIPYLDNLDKEASQIGAVNTIYWKDRQLIGSNTDGQGAARAVEAHLSLKEASVLIIGAGGTTKALAYVFYQKGARVTLTNRTLSKVEAIAKLFKMATVPFNKLQSVIKDQILIVNATKIGMNEHKRLIEPSWLHSNQWVFDCVHTPEITYLLQGALEAGCGIIKGYEMLLQQAVLQQKLWSAEPLLLDKIYAWMKQALYE